MTEKRHALIPLPPSSPRSTQRLKHLIQPKIEIRFAQRKRLRNPVSFFNSCADRIQSIVSLSPQKGTTHRRRKYCAKQPTCYAHLNDESGAIDDVSPHICNPLQYSSASAFHVVVTVAIPCECACMVILCAFRLETVLTTLTIDPVT